MITLFEEYTSDENINLGDFLIIRYEMDHDIIYLVEVTSKGLRDEKSKNIIKYYIRLLAEDNFDDDTQLFYYDINKKIFFTNSYSNFRIQYDIIYKTKNEFEAIDKYEDLLKMIENTKKYNL